MDGNRFDDLTRTLAGGITRRAALTGMAAALLGALRLRSRAGAHSIQAQCDNVKCKNNPGKCNSGCVCCVYGNGNSRCRPPGTCGPGREVSPATTTTAGPATTTTTTATPSTTTSTTAAATTSTTTPCPTACGTQCCSAGQSCINGGCFQRCSSTDDCDSCSGARNCICDDRQTVAGSFCYDVGTSIGSCNSDDDCPSGSLCSRFLGGSLGNLCTQSCCPE